MGNDPLLLGRSSPWDTPRSSPSRLPLILSIPKLSSQLPPKPPHSQAHTPRIVIITSIVVAATAAAVSDRFGNFSQVGGIIGTSVSAAFLIILSIMNIYILYKLVVQLKTIIEHGEQRGADPWVGGGWLFRIFKRMFKFIDRCVILSLGCWLNRELKGRGHV